MDSFNFFDVDLTAAHTDLEITVKRPVKYLQFVADGTLAGISVKVGTQSDVSIPLDEIQILPVTQNPEKIYLTNDLRAGRSTLRIYFARGEKLELYLGGQPISAAEQAVRLGSISRFDRRGEIIFQDGFEEQFHWTLHSIIGYSTCVLSTTRARTGSRSLKMTTGAVSDDTAGIIRSLAYPATPTLGLEMSWVPYGSNDSQFLMGMIVYYGSVRREFSILLDTASQELRYASSLATYTAFATSVSFSTSEFRTGKLVVDIVNGNYVRFITNNTVYDLSQYSSASSGSSVSSRVDARALLITKANVAETTYLDDVIVTKNEPV